MAIRAIGSFVLSFGLVSLPVKLYSARGDEPDISFNLLHKGCGSRLKQQYVCLAENKLVSREDVVKGYEYAPGEFVHFTSDELKALEELSEPLIKLDAFVPLGALDPVYFDTPYFLGPDKGGERAYAVLAQALSQTGLCAVGTYVFRGHQRIVQVRAREGRLVMQQLAYPERIRDITEIPAGDLHPRPQEVELAWAFIERAALPTADLHAYRDEAAARIKQAIEAKVAGKQIVPAPSEAHPAVVDLMGALKASIDSLEARRRPPRRAPRVREVREKKAK